MCFIFLALSRRITPRDAARKIAEARRKGHGLRVQDWQIQTNEESEVAGLAESIINWTRLTLAGCRRPYGIDHFDLTLAFKGENDKRAKSLAFDRLRPIDLYQETFPERLIGMLSKELSSLRSSSLCVSAALFSWGEAAHHALPARI